MRLVNYSNRTRHWLPIAMLLGSMTAGTTVAAESPCATAEQAQQVQAFYRESPGTMPVIAARRLGMPETVVVSGLPAEQWASAPGSAFAEVWTAMTRWGEVTFLIMKGGNVFEIKSAVGVGTPSQTSQYYNIEYKHPLRGHLRPDLYDAIYAIAIPGKEGVLARGIVVYDASGDAVFGAFVSGEGAPPPASEIAKFDEVMALVRSKPSVCPRA
jgi:putative heme iron utilization protein